MVSHWDKGTGDKGAGSAAAGAGAGAPAFSAGDYYRVNSQAAIGSALLGPVSLVLLARGNARMRARFLWGGKGASGLPSLPSAPSAPPMCLFVSSPGSRKLLTNGDGDGTDDALFFLLLFLLLLLLLLLSSFVPRAAEKRCPLRTSPTSSGPAPSSSGRDSPTWQRTRRARASGPGCSFFRVPPLLLACVWRGGPADGPAHLPGPVGWFWLADFRRHTPGVLLLSYFPAPLAPCSDLLAGRGRVQGHPEARALARERDDDDDDEEALPAVPHPPLSSDSLITTPSAATCLPYLTTLSYNLLL